MKNIDKLKTEFEDLLSRQRQQDWEKWHLCMLHRVGLCTEAMRGRQRVSSRQMAANGNRHP